MSVKDRMRLAYEMSKIWDKGVKIATPIIIGLWILSVIANYHKENNTKEHIIVFFVLLIFYGLSRTFTTLFKFLYEDNS